jgi:uncharacterized repeat protein (TIGR01451 family)
MKRLLVRLFILGAFVGLGCIAIAQAQRGADPVAASSDSPPNPLRVDEANLRPMPVDPSRVTASTSADSGQRGLFPKEGLYSQSRPGAATAHTDDRGTAQAADPFNGPPARTARVDSSNPSSARQPTPIAAEQFFDEDSPNADPRTNRLREQRYSNAAQDPRSYPASDQPSGARPMRDAGTTATSAAYQHESGQPTPAAEFADEQEPQAFAGSQEPTLAPEDPNAVGPRSENPPSGRRNSTYETPGDRPLGSTVHDQGMAPGESYAPAATREPYRQPVPEQFGQPGDRGQGYPDQNPAALPMNRPLDSDANPPRGATTGVDNFVQPDRARPLASAPMSQPNAGVQGTGRPGPSELEGVQSPSLSVEKIAPVEVQVGAPAVFETRIRNMGQAAAHDVEISDQVPQGARLLSTTPQANRGSSGELVWSLGTLQPGEEASVRMEVSPTEEGEIGSVAVVRMATEATARSVVTRPQLALRVDSPREVMIGQQVTLKIRVTNSGSGTATGVILESQLPPQLEHPGGPELEYEIGSLKPNESREIDLPLIAGKAGRAENMLVVRGDGNLTAQGQADLEVLAPALEVNVDGPSRRFLERPATYQISVANPGTAVAQHVRLVSYLPPGMKFVKADNYGKYDVETGTVQWLLEELPPGEQGTVEVTAMPTQLGQATLRVQSSAQQGLEAQKDQPIQVEGLAAIFFEVGDIQDPIEVGGETTYEIRVINQGTKVSSNVRVVALLPAGLEAVDADGPARHVVDGNRVLFDGVERLAPKADMTYTVRVKGISPGDLRLKVQLITDDMTTPVTKEESTRVYSDQ